MGGDISHGSPNTSSQVVPFSTPRKMIRRHVLRYKLRVSFLSCRPKWRHLSPLFEYLVADIGPAPIVRDFSTLVEMTEECERVGLCSGGFLSVGVLCPTYILIYKYVVVLAGTRTRTVL